MGLKGGGMRVRCGRRKSTDRPHRTALACGVGEGLGMTKDLC